MGSKSDIEWTDASWTPIRARVKADAAAIAKRKGYTSLVPIAEKMAGHVGPHCERVSPGCVNCYSEANNSRCLPNNGTGLPFDRRARDLVDMFLDVKLLHEPQRWRAPKRIFACSQTDLFGEFVPDAFVMRMWGVMGMCQQHTFQILTKRPDRMRAWLARWANLSGEDAGDFRNARGAEAVRQNHPSGRGQLFAEMLESMGPPPEGCAYPTFDWAEGMLRWPVVLPNVWLGVSVESQAEADTRIPLLLQTPAAMRWISAEPLLSSINLDDGESSWLTCRAGCSEGSETTCTSFMNFGRCFRGIDWVVAGGESGREARPSHPDWLRALRNQCQTASVPFLFKQWGAWAPDENFHKMPTRDDAIHEWCNGAGTVLAHSWRYGKKVAGRELDGREWNEYPA